MEGIHSRGSRLLAALVLALACLSSAWAEIAIVVHPDNPLASLSEAELKRIFLGRMTLFPDTTQEIRAIDLPEDHATFAGFYRQIAQLEGAKLKRYRAYYLFSGRGRLPVTAESAADVLDKVEQDSAAIGYVNAEAVTDQVKVVYVLK